MTREEAKKIVLDEVLKDIEKRGEDAIFCQAPQPGKNSWTLKEVLDAINEDKELENSGLNPIDAMLDLDKYLKGNKQ